MSDEVLWEKHGHIRVLTFNRPDAMNAANVEMLKLHGQYFQEFVVDEDAWVLIFTGTGRARGRCASWASSSSSVT